MLWTNKLRNPAPNFDVDFVFSRRLDDHISTEFWVHHWIASGRNDKFIGWVLFYSFENYAFTMVAWYVVMIASLKGNQWSIWGVAISFDRVLPS